MKKKNQAEKTVVEAPVQEPVEKVAENAAEVKTEKKPVKAENNVSDEKVDYILKCYPQYEEMYIDSRGFVYPAGSPEYQRKDAILYKNKYYNK